MENSKTKLSETETIGMPEWFKDLAIQYQAEISREFILFGDIADLVPNPDDEPQKPYISFREFWEKIFEQREMVILYSKAWGLRFPSRDMEDKFRKAVGLDDDSASASPLAKAGVLQKRPLPQDPGTCLLYLERALRNIKKTAVIIYFSHHIAPAGGPGNTAAAPDERTNIERLIQWAQSEGIKESGGIVLLLTDKIADISQELRQTNSGVKTILVPKPSKEERKFYLRAITEGDEEYRKFRKELLALEAKLEKASPKKRQMVEQEIQLCKEKIVIPPNTFWVPNGFNLNAFSIATQGMSYRQILEMFQRSKQTDKEITLEYAKDKKREILNNEYGDLLEIVEPVMGLDDIGGLDYVKERFTLILQALGAGNYVLVPMGMTLMGPPGTGKTALVEALAKEAGFNFVKTRNLRNMFVGESEARMQNMMYALRSLYPVIVMNDEAEQMESSRDEYSGDSGVSNRMRKMWMEFLSDPKIQGKVLVINCTNRPDLIDVALKRSGRSDDRIPLLLPSLKERKEIFRVLFRFLKVPTTITDFSRAAEFTDELSGADIKKIIEEANRFAFGQNKERVDEAILKEAIEDFIPSASRAEIDRMTLMAIQECSSKRLMPPHVKEIIAKIKARGLVKVDERTDKILTTNNN